MQVGARTMCDLNAHASTDHTLFIDIVDVLSIILLRRSPISVHASLHVVSAIGMLTVNVYLIAYRPVGPTARSV